jgi:ABC-type glycerol-3-phosphate transport system substrate-binding protein
MKEQMPGGFRMEFILPPRVEDGRGDPSTLQVGVEPWLVPTHGPNHALAIDFFKYLTSREKASQFVRAKGSLTAIRGSDAGELPRTLRAPARALREAKVTWTTRYAQWYKPLEDASRTAMASLLQGSLTPEQFVEQVEAAAEKVRNDPNIPKH